jgi:hypothetical protein
MATSGVCPSYLACSRTRLPMHKTSSAVFLRGSPARVRLRRPRQRLSPARPLRPPPQPRGSRSLAGYSPAACASPHPRTGEVCTQSIFLYVWCNTDDLVAPVLLINVQLMTVGVTARFVESRCPYVKARHLYNACHGTVDIGTPFSHVVTAGEFLAGAGDSSPHEKTLTVGEREQTLIPPEPTR